MSRTTSRATCSSQDLIYVGGGNVLSMLGAWRAHGLDAILRKAWRRGIVLCGPSAGSLCWFEQALSAFHGAPRPVRGLGLLPYSNCVHYDAEPARRAEYHRAVADGMRSGFAVEDGVGAALPRHAARARRQLAPRRPRVPRGGQGERRVRDAVWRSPTSGAPDAPGREAAAPGAARAGRRVSELPTAPLDARVIFAMGGGGFTMEPSNPLLDDYVLSLARHQPNRGSCSCRPPRATRPRRSTPSRPASPTARCVAEHLSLFRLRETTRSLRETVPSRTSSTSAAARCATCSRIWRAHELDELLVEAWRSGTVLAGLSAGAMCWFQRGRHALQRAARGDRRASACSTGSLTVHADGEPERLPVWLAGVRDGTLPGGWALDDGVGLLFRGSALDRVVSSRPGAGAQRVDAIAGELVRTRLEPELLGDGPSSALGGHDEAVQEMRRVHRMRRGMGRGGG